MKTRFQPNLIIGMILAFILQHGIALQAQTLTATDNDNDAYVDINWNLPITCFDAGGGIPHAQGVYLELKANGVAIYNETIKQIIPSAVSNTFRHFVGPSKNITYTLNLYVVGPGNTIALCSNLTNPGSTLGFQAPALMTASDATAADRVVISWQNKSKLSSNYQIVRKSSTQARLIATIPGTTQIDSVLTYQDIYAFDDTTSLVNGETYTYCIRTYSGLTKTTFNETLFPSICNDGSTYDIGTIASDFTFLNKVGLTWNNVSAYADVIEIRRNGELIASFNDPATVSYNDESPIYGDTSTYEVVLIKDGVQTVGNSDEGGVDPIGLIAGYVRNDDGYGIPGVKVFYSTSISGITYADSTLTDYTGAYQFPDLFFGISATFIIKIRYEDFTTKPDSVNVILSTQNPAIQPVNFTTDQTFNIGASVITLSDFAATPSNDLLTLNWSFESAGDTTFFQIYREGQLVGIVDNASGAAIEVVDRTAEPEFFYKYELRAYTFIADSIYIASVKDTFQFPVVTAPTNVVVVDDFSAESMGIPTVTWSHNSTNFNGFRIYRNAILLAEITDVSVRNYSDYAGNPGESYVYAVAAIRTANSIIYESERISAPSTVFPDFVEPTNVQAIADANGNAVFVTWSLPSAQIDDDNFTGFKILRNGTEIGEVIKGGNYGFKDLQGIPGTNYTYSVKVFVEQQDTTFMSTGAAAAPLNFPVIDATLPVTTAAGTGKVTLSWAATYNNTHQNFDGFIILVNNVQVDTITRSANTYNYYTPSTGTIAFQVRPYRNINSVIYGAATSSFNGSATNAASVLEAPSSFKASKKYPMHLALSWEYPVYKLSEFIIRRNGVIIATMPPAARSYYDYTAQVGVQYEYYIQASYNSQLSTQVGASGVRRNLGIIQGQLLSDENGRGVDSLEVRLVNGTKVLAHTFTNNVGFYIFEEMPLVVEQSALSVELQTAGRSVDVPVSSKAVTPLPFLNQTITLNFQDNFLLPLYPPRAQRDSIVTILAVEALPLKNKRAVALSWATSEGSYEDFNVYRGFTKLTTTPNTFFVSDAGGVGGISYNYPVSSFGSINGISATGEAGVDSAIFPIFLPIENLSATPSYNGSDNTVVINWSRCTDEVSFYQVERNDQVLGLIAAGQPLTFEDNTGKPNQQYTYTVRAAIQTGNQLMYSDPVSVTIFYPNVTSPDFTLTAVQDSNAVKIDWNYKGDYVNGYRIYRDGVLIATLGVDASVYYDIEGTPNTIHEYSVEAILERDGMTFLSQSLPEEILFPVLRSVVSPMVQTNLNLGNAQLMFNYYARGIDRFEISYTATYTGGSQTQIFSVSYNDLVNNKITFIDELAVPGVAVAYMVTAISVRNNVEYRSAALTVNLASYPLPPTPTAFTATDGTFENRVELNWATDFDANIDGFVIIRYKTSASVTLTSASLTSAMSGINFNTSVADTFIVRPGRRAFAEFFSEIGNDPSANYRYVIVSFNDAYGQRYYSNGATDTGYPSIARQSFNKFTDSNANATFGWSVAIDGSNAIVGAPFSSANGLASWYRKTGNNWNRTNSTGFFAEFGYDVSVKGDYSAVGSPANSSNTGVVSYFSGGFTTGLNNYQNWSGFANSRFGADVVIADGGYSYVNIETLDDIYFFRNNGTTASFNYNNPASTEEYISLDASDTYIVAGAASDVLDVKGYVDIFKRTGDNLAYFNKTLNGEQNGDNFGVDVAISGTTLAIGADKKGSGVVYIYEIDTDGNLDLLQTIQQPTVPNNGVNDRFGWSLALKGDFLIIGARDHASLDGTKSEQGVAYLFQRNGANFEFVEVLTIPKEIADSGGGDEFGYSVAMSDNDMMVGAPYHGTAGAVFFFSKDLVELYHQKLDNVAATDGTLPNQTRVTWTFSGNRKYINGFNIYRDNEKIGSVDATQNIFFDTDGLPGKEYVYTVKVVTNQDRESIGKADKGFRPGVGSLEGAVQTLIGSSPVPGVEIVAEGIAGGEKYIYKGLTGVDGSIKFRNVFIGVDTITYTVKATYQNHEFVQNPIKVALTTEGTIGKALFIDQTAFVVTGKVQLQGLTCGIDSVRVRAISTFQNATATTKETYTNSDGIYTLIVEPDKAGLQEIKIVIDSTHIISRNVEGMSSRDTVLHKFSASAATVFSSFNNFPITQTINFDDTLTYTAKLFVTTVCKTPASNNGLFNIEISTRDGCFQQFYQTGINGRVDAKLPPLDGLIITVKEVAPAQVSNILIVDYLRYRPNMLNLFTIHLDNFTDNYDAETLDSLTFQRLVYHKPPEITLLTTFDRVFCGSDDLVPIISQNQEYTFDFGVEELHNGLNCTVDEGYLVINNSAATNNKDTLRFIAAENKFESHEFTAGLPNLVFPYRKGISVKYFSATNDFLGELIIPVIVEGSTTLPGSDIVVDLGDPDGQFKFISYILRDPPGDGSFTSITENSTVRKTYTRVNSGRFGIGLDTDFTFGSPVGGYYVKGQIVGGFSRTDRNSFDIISTTSQTISTSNAPNFVGPDADVLVGVGVAFRYGIGETLQYDSTTCSMVSIREFTFGPDSIKTDWFYTVGILKQFVKELKAQKVGVQNGTVKISVGGRQLSQSEANERLQVQIENWEAVLNYHAVTSLPHVMFCSETPKIDFTSDLRQFLNQNGLAVITADIDNTKSSRESNAKTARNAFCNQIGTYAGDVFKLNDNVLFGETLKNSYQEAVTKASYWVDSLTYIYSILKNKVSNLSTSESFFPEIENTTFSAGTTITKSTTSTTNSLDVIEQRGFFSVDQAFGFALGIKSGVVIGFGAAVSMEFADIKNKVGIVIKAGYEGGTNEENATSNSSIYTYTLNDNDPGDQFSVTAIKGQQKGYSPYFQLFGGRSSCPPEPGTIQRDLVDLALIDLPTQATFDEQTLNDVSPSGPAKFNVQITNRSPFGEARDIFIYHDGTTNEEGAIVSLGGQRLGGSNESGQTLNFLNPNQPYILPLTIERAPGKYQFDNIKVIARPGCADGNALRDSLGRASRDTVIVSAFFQHPCSPITIASPGDNWVIRRRNPFVQDSRENLIIEIRDYQAKNPVLEEMYIEVRRLGNGAGWERIPTRELDPPYVVLNDSLIAFNDANFAPGDIPKYFFVWDITELYDKYRDGDYEIRAVSFCGASGVLFSNVIKGKINRASNSIFAITQPSDGIYQTGDEISIRVTKELDCNLPQDSIKFIVVDVLTGIPVPGVVACFADNNTLIFQPTNISAYDDRTLRATVYDLTDESGNVYPDTFVWEFKVITRDIYVGDDTLSTRLYRGSTGTLSTKVFANQLMGSINFVVEESYPWLIVTPSNSDADDIGREIIFTIDTDNLPLGDTSAVVVVRSTEVGGGTDTIRVFVEVVPTPPDWVVDPTKFSDLLPMTVITNWKYNNVPGLSRDTLDLISAWIGNEIRGVTPIVDAGGGFFVAYLPVYGNSPADVNKKVEFRIWDASMGREYNASPVVDTLNNVVDTIKYQSGSTIGNTQAPKILVVDPNYDLARYIPLNPNGWTWFSLNSQERDMSVNRMLRELQNGQSGDIIRTRQEAASFVPNTGWVISGGLDSLNVSEGYAIYRGGPADSIRVTGRNARYKVIPLDQGWNFVGYPRQDERGINDILDLLTPTNLDQVFTSRSVLDNNAPGFSQYITASSSWIPSTFNFKPNRAYQIFVRTPTVWVLEGSVVNPLKDPKDELQKTLNTPDPAIPSTWAVNAAAYANSMIVIADIAFDNKVSLDVNDKVAAFVNGECRGVADIQYIPELNKYITTLFVYGNRAGDQVEFRLFDATINKVYRHTEKLAFANNKVIGNVVQPYHFVNLSLPQGILAATDVLCTADSSATVRISSIEGGVPPYKVRWNNGYEGLELNNQTAGKYEVEITDGLGQTSTDSIEVVNQQLTIPTPTILLNGGQAICRNTDIWLEAGLDSMNASYRWYNAEGKLLEENAVFSIPKIQSDATLFVEANVNGCVSQRMEVPVKVQAPAANFTVLPNEVLTTGDTVYLRPSAGVNAAFSYQWTVGNNFTSRTPEVFYVFETPGLYDVTLKVTDADGCETTTSKKNELQVLLATAVENITSLSMSLSASPNPFARQVKAAVQVEQAGEYLFKMRDMTGRTVWYQKHTLIAGKNETLLDLRTAGLPEGAYLLEVSNKIGNRAIVKLIKRATP